VPFGGVPVGGVPDGGCPGWDDVVVESAAYAVMPVDAAANNTMTVRTMVMGFFNFNNCIIMITSRFTSILFLAGNRHMNKLCGFYEEESPISGPG
jgi:hypothetical protein